MDSSLGIACLLHILPFSLVCSINLYLREWGAHNTVAFGLRFSIFVLHGPVCTLVTNHVNMDLTLNVWLLPGIESSLDFASPFFGAYLIFVLKCFLFLFFKRIWSL